MKNEIRKIRKCRKKNAGCDTSLRRENAGDRTLRSAPCLGSALLISLLLMAFLMVFGFGISKIVVDSIRMERNVVDAGMAYFSAEGAVESALYYRENRLPGYEAQDDLTVNTQAVELENGALMTYNMVAAEITVPCAHEENEWRELGIQESVSWPLYRWDADAGAGRVDLEAFTLFFKVEDSDEVLRLVSGNVLRWKILGIDETSGHTQAISGLLGYDGALTQADEASFYEGSEGGTYVYYDDYPISEFLKNHYFSTLILTNVIYLPDQDALKQSPDDNVLKLQLSTDNGGSVSGSPCEYTLIQADGTSNDVTQNIDVRVRLDSFLPVFNFVLYETKGGT